MKTQFNITSMKWDLERYTSVEDFATALEGFDGVELMDYGDDISPIIPEEKVIGIHMRCPYHWLDFWNGDMERCIREYGSEKQVYENFGGTDRQALVDAFLQDWNRALLHQAEYAVYHISDVTCMECLTGEYAHTDEEVIDAACEMINQALPATAEGPWLLLENLWHPGLTFTRPEMTRRLLEGIHYPKTGFMLDTGHLMHTDLELNSQEEAVSYIHRCLDQHGELCDHIRGIHLNQSLTGAYRKQLMENLPELSEDYNERMKKIYTCVFRMDQHKPFTCAGVRELIKRIDPDYLTYEFISNNREEHMELLRQQRQALQER